MRTAPKPITRHLVLSAPPALPTPASPSESNPSPATLYQNPPRQAYPPELLKHRFKPYGVRGHDEEAITDIGTAMQVDTDQGDVEENKVAVKEKGTKRKADGSPKKSKKAKTS